MLRTVRGRRLLREFGILVAIFVVGYGVAFFWLSPVPIFTSDHAAPRVLELSVEDATKKLEHLSFRTRFATARPHPTSPRGTIVWQDPPSGTIAAEGSAVQLTASSGLPQVAIPDLIGFAEPLARKVLAAAGLAVGSVDTVPGNAIGVVAGTRPAAGVARDPGSAVDLIVSGGQLVGVPR